MSKSIFDTTESLSGRFMDIAKVFPERNALHINGQYYSYTQLAQRVQEIADTIAQTGAKRVAIYCHSSIETYASILAVNLLGAAYIPLNPKFPEARNKKIIELCKPDLILYGQEYIQNIPVDSSNEGLCYILFTSGSTGEPKGVPVSNENVRHFFNYFLKEYDFNEEDKFLQCYELTFDVSVFSFFMPLLVGACCYVLPDEGIRPMKIAEQLKHKKITVVSMVPSVLNYLKNYFSEIQLPDLRYSFFSGDVLLHSVAAAWKHCLPNGMIHSFYGPTETTIVCTRYVFDEVSSAKESVNNVVPLGKAFPGMEFKIVDDGNEMAEKGELCFSGTQVIEKYLDGKYETFFFEKEGKRFYKTGDLASLNAEGNLIFYGRKDDQIKINGYRVELGEIKSALEKVTGCKAELIFEKRLIAFVEQVKLKEEEIKEQLLFLLPEYMIPQQFIFVDELPLNINGKTDKQQLLNLQR